MGCDFLDNLSLSDLENLKLSLSSGDIHTKKLIDEINRKINFKKKIELGIVDFSASRLPNYMVENEEDCLRLLEQIFINELPFLKTAMSRDAKGVNAMSFLPLSRIGEGLNSDNCSLIKLDDFFKDFDYVHSHEGVYNTFNYIKNYIYGLLINNQNITKEDVFADYDDKYCLVCEQIADIASYLYEIRKDSDEIKLSIGNAGLYGTTKRDDTSKTLTRFQRRFADAITFGISYEKLEKRDYEECKRLLFVPKDKRYR